MDIEKMANDYLAEIMPTNQNINPSEYQAEYDAFIAGANAVKNCSIPDVVGRSEQLVCDQCKCHPTVLYNTTTGRFCDACKPKAN